MANNAPEPLPLSAPDGEVIAYACPRCRTVRSSCSTIGTPDAQQRAQTLAFSFDGCKRCCICRTCGVDTSSEVAAWRGVCGKCSTAEDLAREPERRAQEAASKSEATEWAFWAQRALEGFDGDWPLTVIGVRDGLGYAAFPLDYDRIPTELTERVEAMIWLEQHGSDLFGLASTPEAAIEDLRTKAKRVR